MANLAKLGLDSPREAQSPRFEAYKPSVRVDNTMTHTSEVELTDNDDGMSWEVHGKAAMCEFVDTRLRAKGLPHRIYDFMNTSTPLMKQNPEYHRCIFKAMMQSSTAETEPHAPQIDIVNEVDEEPCPPPEFVYSNHIWYSDNVLPRDAPRLEGCGCYPVCMSGSSCSCLKKQQEVYDEGMSGFNYSGNRILHDEYPVFECNAMCGCDDDCGNRVCGNAFIV